MANFPASVRAAVAALLLGVALGSGACNDVGTCPAASAISNGGSCSGDNLECPFTLVTPSPACDGTTTQIPTSCVCTSGSWSCPSPVVCGEPDAGEEGGGDDGGSMEGSADAAGG
jgi:hypothetical protein